MNGSSSRGRGSQGIARGSSVDDSPGAPQHTLMDVISVLREQGTKVMVTRHLATPLMAKQRRRGQITAKSTRLPVFSEDFRGNCEDDSPADLHKVHQAGWAILDAAHVNKYIEAYGSLPPKHQWQSKFRFPHIGHHWPGNLGQVIF